MVLFSCVYSNFFISVLQSAVGPSVKTEPREDFVVVPKLDSGQLSLTIDLSKEPEEILGSNLRIFRPCLFVFSVSELVSANLEQQEALDAVIPAAPDNICRATQTE